MTPESLALAPSFLAESKHPRLLWSGFCLLCAMLNTEAQSWPQAAPEKKAPAGLLLKLFLAHPCLPGDCCPSFLQSAELCELPEKLLGPSKGVFCAAVLQLLLRWHETPPQELMSSSCSGEKWLSRGRKRARGLSWQPPGWDDHCKLTRTYVSELHLISAGFDFIGRLSC